LIAITGGSGFLGWHTRVRARALGRPDPVVVTQLDQPERFASQIEGAERVVHLAGVNRGDVEANVELARQLVDALHRCATPPKTVVYANSVQAGNGTAYGDAKATAAALLAEATRWSGSTFVDLKLPNLFGEHGRPNYNSVVATFCRMLADGNRPRIEQDRELELLHAGDAAGLLLGLDAPAPQRRSVLHLADRLTQFADAYRTGDIPSLADRFDVRLFNTYRSHCPAGNPVVLTRHADTRGELFEAVRSPGAGGTTFCSSTHPGVTRGEHFHLAKVERFLVLSGEAEISMRRVLHGDVVRFRVSGDEPTAVDMPTMWAHNISNVGDRELLTLFWSNGAFDPADPDTFAEPVTAP
jgi:UDP-2-acetamido-2,6-beta-L-arabino-hexul-4-ose reductase